MEKQSTHYKINQRIDPPRSINMKYSIDHARKIINIEMIFLKILGHILYNYYF